MPDARKPCQFCQRSRWLLSITVLIVMATVAFLNLSAPV